MLLPIYSSQILSLSWYAPYLKQTIQWKIFANIYCELTYVCCIFDYSAYENSFSFHNMMQKVLLFCVLNQWRIKKIIIPRSSRDVDL